MPRLLLGLCLIPLLAGCGSLEPDRIDGRVTDLAGRLCLQTTAEQVTCMSASDEVLASVSQGACVRVRFTKESINSLPAVQEVSPSERECDFPPL